MNEHEAPEWTSAEYLANIAAEELTNAMTQLGIGIVTSYSQTDGTVAVNFQGLADAETFMTLTLTSDETPGSLYDRATASCVTLTGYGQLENEPSREAIEDAVRAGWTWTVHPAMRGRRMDWHVMVEIPVDDAHHLTARLNQLRLGGGV